jgi:DNA-binding MarR family transcriptional regulator
MVEPTTYPAAGRDAAGGLSSSLAQSLPFMLLRATTAAGRLARDTLGPLGIDGRHYGVLASVADQGPQSQQELADTLKVDRSTMVALIDELEKASLVRRRRSTTDRRAYAIELTAAGRRARTRAATLLERCEATFLTPLTGAERQELKRLLGKLIESNA